MSAIWGAIAFDNKPLPADLGQRMKQPYNKCVIDRFEEYFDGHVLLGCGLQYFTPEARHETLPIVNGDTRAMFTADIMLDNRAELMDRLHMDERAGVVPDGSIAYQMFNRFGEDCLNDLLGAYAFVYYDAERNKASLVIDATGNRCFYYGIKQGVLYFSTMIEPLLETVGFEGFNERWLVDFLALDNMAFRTEFEETPYLGIYRVAPRQIVTYDGEALKKRLYWNPEPVMLKLDNDEAYAARLKEIYKECIRCVLRAEKISIFLSGGLDSTSVACYAARELRDQGKPLYSYTSVPEFESIKNSERHLINDESKLVMETKAYLEENGCQLECAFLPLTGRNGWDERETEINALEFPYKSFQNMLWIREGFEQAYRAGSRIMLNGGFGNVTISAGDIDLPLYELIRKGHFLSFMKQIRLFGRTYRLSRKNKIRQMFKIGKDAFIPKKPDASEAALLGKSLARKELLRKYNAKGRLYQNAKAAEKSNARYKPSRQVLIHDLLFSLIGEMRTKQTITTGVILRDPTLDKRLIEFCMSLPADQFAKNGVSRRLVREYMADDLPPHVANQIDRGQQSADMAQRMGRHWDRIYKELHSIFSNNKDNPVVDCDRALEELDRITEDYENVQNFDLLRIEYTALMLEFIRRSNK